MAPLVTVVIVNYETSAYVRRCVSSLTVQDYPHEVVVVDNPSPADDYKNLPTGPNVKVVRAPKNLGYGLGCNFAAQHASPESTYICVLNPDTAVPPGELMMWIKSYQSTCPGGGLHGPALHNDNGTIQRSSYKFMTGVSYWVTHSILAGFLINRRKGSWTGGKGTGFKEAAEVPEADFKRSETSGALAMPVGWLMGAALLCDRKTWESLGGFSDKYFMYSEDTDICWRCRLLGLPVIYDPGIHIWHSQGDPSATAREKGIVMLFDGLKRFVDLNYTGLRRCGMYFSVIADMTLRVLILFPLSYLKPRSELIQSRLRGYKKVIRQWAGGA